MRIKFTSSCLFTFSKNITQVFAKEVKDFQKSDRDKKHKEGDPQGREKKEDKENLLEAGWFGLQQYISCRICNPLKRLAH